MRILLVFLLALTACWCAGNLVLGGIVASGVFSFAPPKGDVVSRAVAGALFGEVLARWAAVVAVSFQIAVPGLLLMLTGAAISLRRHVAAGICVTAVVGLILIHTWSGSVLTQARAAAPPTDPAKPYSSEQQEAFVVLHRSSERLFIVESFLLLLVVVGAGIALAKRDRVETSAPLPVR